MSGVRVWLIAFALSAPPVLAQPQPPQPPRDTPTRPPAMPAGTAVIKGRVVDAQTGSALPRARVRLNWMGPSGSSRPPAVTDQTGRFTFSALPAGAFSLIADKPTYTVTRFPEGGETLRTGSRSLTLTDGQAVDTIVIRMFHGGVIAGRVVDGYGDPAEFAQVQALKLPKSGRGMPQQRSGVSTNDLGEFRLARLEPGKYLVMVMPQRRDMVEQPGNTLPETPEPQALPTFFPAALSMSDAQPIAVERGQTTANVEIALVEGTPATVTGVVVDATGQPIGRGGSISVRPILKDVPQNGFGSAGGGLKPDGTFALRLPPGEYQLEARANPPATNGPPSPGSEQFGTVRLNVSSDMAGVTIQLGPGARVTGRFVFDGSAPQPQPPTSPNGPPLFTSNDGSCRTGRNQIAADWTFTSEGLSGTCFARFNGGYPRWFFKAIVYESKDLTDQRITFTPGQRMRDVVVLFTDKRTELNLHVVDDRGAATRDYVVLAFPTDKSKWTDPNGGFGGGSRYVRTFVLPPQAAIAPVTAQPGQSAGQSARENQREAVTGLPAGEYYVVAVDDIDGESARDSDMLEQLSQGATRVTLADGEPSDVNLRVIRLNRP
jgi:protocatechuate 3,4-dioxygenase beta subunit